METDCHHICHVATFRCIPPKETEMVDRRRLAAAFTVAAVAMTALAACGSDKASGGSKTLDVLVSANTIYPDQQRQWFADVSAKFEKQTGAKVTFETFASPTDELTKI